MQPASPSLAAPTSWRAAGLALALSVLGGLVVACVLERVCPDPSADARSGSVQAFALDGLHEREYAGPERTPAHWTEARARFSFRQLGPGPVRLELRGWGHHAPVRVLANGALVGQLPAGQRTLDLELTGSHGERVDIELLSQPFAARGGRRLGTLLGRVTVRPSRPTWPRLSLLLGFGLVALLACGAALLAGLPPLAALAVALATLGTGAALSWPDGLLHSRYAASLALELGVSSCAAALVARLVRPDLRRATFVAALTALLLQLVVALHPLMVGFDAEFHAHKLGEVAAGNLFPISLTQHAAPFRFPYGVSFQALLAPLAWTGLAPRALVEGGAVASGLLLSALLFALVARRSPALAAPAVIALQIVPWSVEVFSNANYSNAFGQAATFAFLAWWAAATPGGALVGAALLALAGLGHLSSFFVALALCAALGLVARRELLSDRTRRLALLLGLGLALLYYGHFLGLALEQLPRLGQGAGGQGTANPVAALLRQAGAMLTGWGWPAMLLAVLGRPSAEEREWRAVWLAGAGLALLATLSPIEVRYVYALAPAVAVAMAAGFRRLWQAGDISRALALGLVLAQAGLALQRVAQALLSDWR